MFSEGDIILKHTNAHQYAEKGLELLGTWNFKDIISAVHLENTGHNVSTVQQFTLKFEERRIDIGY